MREEVSLADITADIEITCINCGYSFLWTTSQQRFYAEKHMSRPKRCKPCAAKRKAEIEAARGGW